MTDIDLLKNCVRTLNSVSVPCGLTDQIAVPVSNVSKALSALIKGIEEKIQKAAKEAEKASEVPSIHPVEEFVKDEDVVHEFDEIKEPD